MTSYEPRIVCFSCKFGWGYLGNENDIAAKVKLWIPIICSGKIDTTHILKAFNEGADGVLILGCREGECHYQDGNLEARKRVYVLHKVLESFGIEKERLEIKLSLNPSGLEIPKFVKELAEKIKKLGPTKRNLKVLKTR